MPSHTLMAMICLDYRETWGAGTERDVFAYGGGTCRLLGVHGGHRQPSTQPETGPLLFVALDIRLTGPSF